MKDSGVDWIGGIPQIWELHRARFLFRQSTSKGNNRLVLLSATQDRGVVDKSTLDSVVQVAQDADLSLFKTVHKNDFVISLRSFQGGFEIAHEEGVISPAYTVFRLTNQDYPHYYKYLFKSYGFIDKINSLTVGIREGKNIQYVDFSNMLLPYFNVAEQQKIASFLDKKCAEIEEMITLQEKIIEELKAYKQSVITEAVTKGLNPNVPMKESGIEWIGQIPAHWEVIPTKRNFDIIAGATPKSDNVDFWDGNIPWITPADYKTEDRFVFIGKRFLTNKGMESCSTTLLPVGSIIFSKRAPIGLVAINSQPLCTNQGCLGCIPRNAHSVFFYYAMSAFTEQYGLYGSGTTFKEISASKFADFNLPSPSFLEQQSIADYLDTKCTEIDNLISIKQQKIEHLKEYKKSIIYEYVTGKKEVED